MTRFMLDTNIVSAVIHGRSRPLDRRMSATSPSSLCISVITFAETAFGLAKRPAATTLAAATGDLFRRISVLDFDREAGAVYGTLRAELEARGTPLSPLDMLIAAHALAAGVTLVSNDKAFRLVSNLSLEDWTAV
jgi:tRNA(fMet)-specific endonuclease VapC